MKRSYLRLMLFVCGLGMLLLAPLLWLTGLDSQAAAPACDQTTLSQVKVHFSRMLIWREQTPYALTEAEFQMAALNYIAKMEYCATHASRPSSQAITASLRIDEGGLWAPGRYPLSSQYNTGDPNQAGLGSKWDPTGVYTYPGGQDTPPPMPRPGGLVTYSFMTGTVAHNDIQTDQNEPNVSVLTGLGLDETCVRQNIASAFAAWSAVADIQFREVPDNGRAAGASGPAAISALGHTHSRQIF